MDERFVKKLLIPSFIIVSLSTVFFYELKYLIDTLFFKKKHMLVIGILSAPENFEQRLSIRKTWLKLLPEVSGSSYFIIGNEICEVPLVDRPDPYTCIEKPFTLHKNVTTEYEFTTMKIIDKNELQLPKISVIGYGFYVRRRISVKKLGVLKEILNFYKSEVQVKLFSAFDNKVLASVTFSPEVLHETVSEVLIKSIRPVTLFDSNEAYIKLEAQVPPKSFLPSCDFVDWNNEPNVLNFIYLWHEDSVIPQKFIENSCTFVLMNYSILDVDQIKQLISNRNLRKKDWAKRNKVLSANLKNESRIFNDLMFVDVVDVYRNLSLKMIEFYKRIVETEYFHYVLKADDDSFVDLIRVHNQLKAVNKKLDDEISQNLPVNREIGLVSRIRLSIFWWWSSFKEFWKVQRSGKWREEKYQSVSYPTFPCGGGYVINKGIVDYIAANGRNFNHFQGEDVSIGIWLSSLPVTTYKISKTRFGSNSYLLQSKIITKFSGKQSWLQYKANRKIVDLATDLCEWTCSNKREFNIPFCNKVQITVKEMYNIWEEYISCGFL